jgi:hypothetical protein
LGDRVFTRSAVFASAVVLLTAGVFLSGCSPLERPLAVPTKESVDAKPAAAEAARLEPAWSSAADYIVAPGLRWLFTLRPDRLTAHLDALSVPFPDATRRAAFEHSLGVQLGELADAAIAGFDYSTVYAVQTRQPLDAKRTTPLSRFNARNAVEPLVRDVLGTALYTGVRQDMPQHYAQLDSLTHVWSEGDPSSIKASILLARGRLTKTPPALRGASLSLLPDHCHAADIEFFAAGPIEETLETPSSAPSAVLGLILAAFVGVSFQEDTLHVNGCVVGDWGPEGKERVSALLTALREHSFVSLLGLTESETQPLVSQVNDVVAFSYTWNATRTLSRIHALVELRLDELIGSPPRDALPP